MKHLFLTGEIQVGKSTAIRRYLAARPSLRVGGFRTVAGPGESGGDGIYMIPGGQDVPLTQENLAFLRWKEGQAKGFTVFPGVFETLGSALLRSGPCDLILMDELGVREEDAPNFQRNVLRALNETIPVLGVVQQRVSPFLDAVRAHPGAEVWTVTRENREDVFQRLLRWE